MLHIQAAKVVSTMVGHTDRVNCVEWLPPNGKRRPASAIAPTPALVLKLATCLAGFKTSHVVASGAADNHVIIWLYHPDDVQQPWSIAARLEVRPTCMHPDDHSAEMQPVTAHTTCLLLSSSRDVSFCPFLKVLLTFMLTWCQTV